MDKHPFYLLGVNRVNIIQTQPNPYDTMKAINKLDFIFCEEMMAGETAIWSDIVLPDTVYLERYDGLYAYDGLTPYLTVRQPVVKPMFDVKSPYAIAQGLAKKLDIKGYSCTDEKEFLNEELKAAGLSLDKLNKKGGLVTYPGNPYRDPGKLKVGTESGKIQLFVEDFDDEDLNGIPKFEPTPAPPKGYSRLVYGRAPMHTFSRTMNNLWLSYEMPENSLWLNDKVADKLGIENDEEVILENQDGKKSNPIKVLVTPGIRKALGKKLNLNPAMRKFGVCAYLPKMRGINGADVFKYFKPLITKQIR